MKNGTTFVRMRSGDHLRDANVEKRHLAPSDLTFLLIAIDRDGFRRMKDEGQIYKTLLNMLFQSLVMSFPLVFSTLKDHNYVPGQKIKKLRHGL